MADSYTPNIYHQAIEAALNAEWKEAVKLNKEIIKLEPQNVDALNRQAKAYMELGNNSLAKKYYSQSLKYDPYNPIAQKNLKIIKSFKSSKNKNDSEQEIIPQNKQKLSASLFLQEPGKTKIVNLLKVAEPQKLSKAYCGMQVRMLVKGKKITIVDENDNYLGILPDDVSHHMVRLIDGGNKYDLVIKSVKVNGLSIMIKETFRSKKFKNQPSFIESSGSVINNDLLTHQDIESEENEDTDAMNDTEN